MHPFCDSMCWFGPNIDGPVSIGSSATLNPGTSCVAPIFGGVDLFVAPDPGGVVLAAGCRALTRNTNHDLNIDGTAATSVAMSVDAPLRGMRSRPRSRRRWLICKFGSRQEVIDGRVAFQTDTEDQFTVAIERLTQRHVVAFLSANQTTPGCACELVFLDDELEQA
jgi:hypothetical protein